MMGDAQGERMSTVDLTYYHFGNYQLNPCVEVHLKQAAITALEVLLPLLLIGTCDWCLLVPCLFCCFCFHRLCIIHCNDVVLSTLRGKHPNLPFSHLSSDPAYWKLIPRCRSCGSSALIG